MEVHAPAPPTAAAFSRTPDDAAALRAFLQERDAPCPSCGYNLRALTAASCPECNQPLALRVNLVEPKLRAWVAGLIGLATGAGFSGLLFLFGMWMIFIRGSNSPPNYFFVMTSIGFVVEGAMLLLIVMQGRAFRRFQAPVRLCLAVGCWLLTLANLISFSLLVK